MIQQMEQTRQTKKLKQTLIQEIIPKIKKGNHPITDQDGSRSKEIGDILPLYFGGGITLLILFTGHIICYFIVKYPHWKL